MESPQLMRVPLGRHTRILAIPRSCLAFLTIAWGLSLITPRSEAQSSPTRCAPVTDTLPAEAAAASLAGTYRLTIVGTDGKATGRMATSSLKLWAPPDTFRFVRQLDGRSNPNLTIPLIGATEIDLQQVGAVEDGGWAATTPEAPGIAVWQRRIFHEGRLFTEILLRLGADGNRRGRVRFDGPYNALYVDSIGSTGFWGRWHASLGYTDYKADGYFCALRQE